MTSIIRIFFRDAPRGVALEGDLATTSKCTFSIDSRSPSASIVISLALNLCGLCIYTMDGKVLPNSEANGWNLATLLVTEKA